MDRVVRPLALKVPLSAEELAAPKEAVCVTGASGYIASFVVQRLLAAGHTGARPRRRGLFARLAGLRAAAATLWPSVSWCFSACTYNFAGWGT